MKKSLIILSVLVIVFISFALNVYATDNGIMYKGTQSGSYVSSSANANSASEKSVRLLNAIAIASLVGTILSFILAGVANKNGEKRKRTVLVILGILLIVVIAILVPTMNVIG